MVLDAGGWCDGRVRQAPGSGYALSRFPADQADIVDGDDQLGHTGNLPSFISGRPTLGLGCGHAGRAAWPPRKQRPVILRIIDEASRRASGLFGFPRERLRYRPGVGLSRSCFGFAGLEVTVTASSFVRAAASAAGAAAWPAGVRV